MAFVGNFQRKNIRHRTYKTYPILLILKLSKKITHFLLFLPGPRRIHPTPKKGYQFHLGPNQRKDLKCNGCLKIVSSIKIGLLSNSTVDEIKEVVNGACNVTRMQIKVQVRNLTIY